MIPLLLVIAGASAVLAAAWLAGRALAQQLTPSLSFGIGAIALSYAIFGLMLTRHASLGALSFVLTACIVAGLLRRPNFTLHPPPLVSLLVFVPFSVWYLVNSLAPEVQADPNVYHLQSALESFRFGGFSNTVSFYDRLPHGLEMLFVPAWRIGGSAAAKLVHLGFLFATLPLIVYTARLLKLSDAAAFGAAALYFCTPVVGFAGVAAFNDAALVYFTVAAVALAMEDRPWHAGLIAGFCYAVKMTGLMAVPVTVGFFVFRKQWRRASYVCIAAGFACFPWLLRNWVQTGNPLAPFMNSWFPNPYIYVWTEQTLMHALRDYGVPFWQRLPEVLAGSRLHGILGPMFVLAPIALLAARKRNGLVLLAIAAAFSVTWWMNAGARFIMAALPFLALAMCATLPRRAIVALVALHAVTSWPMMVGLYSPRSLHLREFPLRAALGIESEESYLSRTSFDYRYAQMVMKNTPANARILDLWGLHTVYSSRELISSWRSAQAVRLVDGLNFARPQARTPLVAIQAAFEPQPICGFRAVLTADLPTPWAMHSMEVRRDGGPVLTPSQRLVSSSKMRWEIPLALDANPVSRWSTGQAGERGDYIQVEFSQPVMADSVHLLAPASAREPSVRIDICKLGAWKPLPVRTMEGPILNLRPAAVQSLKQAGITHLVVPASSDGMGVLGDQLVNTADDWNLEVVSNLDAAYVLKVR